MAVGADGIDWDVLAELTRAGLDSQGIKDLAAKVEAERRTKTKTPPVPVGIRIPESPLDGTSRIGGGLYTGTPGAAPVVPVAPAATTAAPAAPRVDLATQARLLFRYLPEALLNEFIQFWDELGDPNLALSKVRQGDLYETFYPGNRREDGTVRLSEAEWTSTMEGYDRELASFGLSGKDFQAKKIEALKNGRSPDELGAAVGKVYLGIATRQDSYKAFYAQKYGDGNVSVAAILGSALDGSKSPYEFERSIRAAQVGGAAGMFGFDIARQEADRLESFGLDDTAARTLYAQAAGQLPTLNTLMDRFNDPDDELTVEEYADAFVLSDPKQLQQIGRLFAQDRSTFSSGGFAGVDQRGGQRGLLAR